MYAENVIEHCDPATLEPVFLHVSRSSIEGTLALDLLSVYDLYLDCNCHLLGLRARHASRQCIAI